jgi:nucleotidyltransferase substrate binding protein (TIGR01987 family)
MSMLSDIRWKQRFEHFTQAYTQLEASLDAHARYPENLIYPMAVIQSFEFTYELAWKTLKDFLVCNGVQTSLPKETLKLAFKHNLIDNGQVWITMLEDRNLLSHTYSTQASKDAIKRIQTLYNDLFKTFKEEFKVKYDQD